MCHSVIMVQFVKAQNDDSGFPTASNAQGDQVISPWKAQAAILCPTTYNVNHQMCPLNKPCLATVKGVVDACGQYYR